jgi:hypothetical protein
MGILLGCFGRKRGPLCFCLFGWCLPLGNKALTPAFVVLPQLHPTPPLASLSDPYMLKDLFLHAKWPHILLCFTLQKQSITEHYFFHARVESS